MPHALQRIGAVLLGAALLGTVLLVATLAGCGSSAPPAAGNLVGQVCCEPPADGPDTVGGVATAHDGWDIAFVNYFASHDAVAGQMAALAQAQSASPAVKDIATVIDAEPAGRFLKLSAMATAWQQPVPSTDPAAAGGHDHGGGRTEADDLAELTPLRGHAFDVVFLQVMVRHHQAGITQARSTIDNGTNPQAGDVARQLVADQTPQLQQLEALQKAV
jgi:uncharacterized protein (DUF305 family)